MNDSRTRTTPRATTATTVRQFCLDVLESGDLESKLVPPVRPDGGVLDDREPGPALRFDRPARNPEIEMHPGSERLPKAAQLADPGARALCLERFANHELQAVELFAWFLLAFPDAPAGLRRGILRTLADEQIHLRLYLDRVEAHGAHFGDHPPTEYFWRQIPAVSTGDAGIRTFLATMGLTFEQANLDHSLFYAEAFERAGDPESARVIERVHADEVRHVGLAVRWMRRLRQPGETDIEAYVNAIRFPLSAARAKGRWFSETARRAAGMNDEMIEFIRAARPYERARRGTPDRSGHAGTDDSTEPTEPD